MRAWAGLLGGPLAGAVLVVGYIIARLGRHDAIGVWAVLVHALAVVLLLLAIPATHRLRQDPEARGPLIAGWILCVVPCGAWILNSAGVVMKALLG